MKSNTKIEKQTQRKTNQEIVETIIAAKKKEGWNELAGILSSPRRNRISLNLNEIEKKAPAEGNVIVIPGKVLSQGEINKKMKIVALNFSEKAREKLLNSKYEILSILEEIKKNPDAKGVKILR